MIKWIFLCLLMLVVSCNPNTFPQSSSMLKGIDLCMVDISIPDSIHAPTDVWYKLTFKNCGTVSLYQDFFIGVLLYGPDPHGTLVLNGLVPDPGEHGTMLVHTPIDFPGHYTIAIELDAVHEIQELNENNNIMKKKFDVF